MRAILQRVSEASVTIDGTVRGQIEAGLLVLIGMEPEDSTDDVSWLAGKIARMRIFPDAEGHMNLSLLEGGGAVLVVSQFTLHASTKKGNRPSFIRAARPEVAIPLYEEFLRAMETETGKPPQCGEFGADMKVRLLNDGPVTIFMDTRNRE